MKYQEYVAEKNKLQSELADVRDKLTALEKYYHYFGEQSDKKEEELFNIPISKLIPMNTGEIGATDKVRHFIHAASDWFRNADVVAYLNQHYPGHNLGTTRVSTILATLYKSGEIEKIENPNRKEGHKYRQRTITSK